MVMKAKPNDSGEFGKEVEELFASPAAEKESKKPKFYDSDAINYDLFTSRLPMLKQMRGSKRKLQSHVFSEIDDIFQSIFEKNKSTFMTKGHVIQHLVYIAGRIGEQVYLIRKDFPRDPMSELLEKHESMYKFLDKVDIAIEKTRFYFEKKCKRVMSEEHFNKEITALLDTFPDKEQRKIVAEQINDLLQNDEELRVQQRLKKRRQRDEENNVINLPVYR
jgi:hypothetical protein